MTGQTPSPSYLKLVKDKNFLVTFNVIPNIKHLHYNLDP